MGRSYCYSDHVFGYFLSDCIKTSSRCVIREKGKYFIGHDSLGSGIPEVKVIMHGFKMDNYLTTRTLVAKMVGLTLAMGGGLPIGKEVSRVRKMGSCSLVDGPNGFNHNNPLNFCVFFFLSSFSRRNYLTKKWRKQIEESRNAPGNGSRNKFGGFFVVALPAYGNTFLNFQGPFVHMGAIVATLLSKITSACQYSAFFSNEG